MKVTIKPEKYYGSGAHGNHQIRKDKAMKKIVVGLLICVIAIAVIADTNAGNDQQKRRSDDRTTNEVNADAWPQSGKCNYECQVETNSVFSQSQNTDTNQLAELERLAQRIRAVNEMERGRKYGFDAKDIPLLLKKFKFLILGVAYGLYVLFQRLDKNK